MPGNLTSPITEMEDSAREAYSNTFKESPSLTFLDNLTASLQKKTSRSLFLVSPFMVLSSNLAFLVTFEVNPPA